MARPITDHEADVVSAMMEVFIHATERTVTVLERYYEQQYMNTDDYKLLEKHAIAQAKALLPPNPTPQQKRKAVQAGMASAREYLHKANKKVLRHDNKLKIQKWLDTANLLHDITEKFTDVGMHNAVQPGTSPIEMFDALQNDAQFLCRVFCYCGNHDEEDALLKIESMIKNTGKRQNVDPEFLREYFTPTI